MLYNFQWKVPTNLLFGKDQLSRLPELIPDDCSRVLLVYGMGSIKDNGVYERILDHLDNYNVVELSGVSANPDVSKVREGVDLCEKNGIDLIIACGGGSVIDAAKVIAVSAQSHADAWELVLNRSLIKGSLPVIAVLTTAASGSEMDRSAVISNKSNKEKRTIASPFMYPYASICDPSFLLSLPKGQIAAGIVDVFSHAFEMFFDRSSDAYISDQLCISVMKTCIRYGVDAVKNDFDYKVMANIMWCSTFISCGMAQWGRGRVLFPCHVIEHELSARYPITHGVGLAIIMPCWYEYTCISPDNDKYYSFAKEVWNSSCIDKEEGIKDGLIRLKNWLTDLSMPTKLSELNIPDSEFEEMSHKATGAGGLVNSYPPLDSQDVYRLLVKCW